MKSLTLHAHPGPNPWKVALVLEELFLPYTVKVWQTGDQKKPPFTTTLNPNGFTPVLEDPNPSPPIILWESGAIIEYLLEIYDTNYTISFPLSATRERNLVRQFSWFQATFQGPNLSAAFYFARNSNAEARKRFVDESIRVLDVLEVSLAGDIQPDAEKKDWLVGGMCTAADLAFAPYILISMANILGPDKPDVAKEYPHVDAWIQRINSRPSVQKVLADRITKVAAAAAIAPAK